MGPDFATCPGFALSCLRYLKMTFGYLWLFYDVGNLFYVVFFGGEPRRNPQAFPRKAPFSRPGKSTWKKRPKKRRT